jgi:hypothetical protein
MHQVRHVIKTLNVGWSFKVNSGWYLQDHYSHLMVDETYNRADHPDDEPGFIASKPWVWDEWADQVEHTAIQYSLKEAEIMKHFWQQYERVDQAVRSTNRPPCDHIESLVNSVRVRDRTVPSPVGVCAHGACGVACVVGGRLCVVGVRAVDGVVCAAAV